MPRPCLTLTADATAVCDRPVAHVVIVARDVAGRIQPRPIPCCSQCLPRVAESAGRAGTFVGAVGWSAGPDVDVGNELPAGTVARMGGPQAGDRVRLVDGRVVTYGDAATLLLWHRLTFAWCVSLQVDDRVHLTYVAPSFVVPGEWQEQFNRATRRAALERARAREG